MQKADLKKLYCDKLTTEFMATLDDAFRDSMTNDEYNEYYARVWAIVDREYINPKGK